MKRGFLSLERAFFRVFVCFLFTCITCFNFGGFSGSLRSADALFN